MVYGVTVRCTLLCNNAFQCTHKILQEKWELIITSILKVLANTVYCGHLLNLVNNRRSYHY